MTFEGNILLDATEADIEMDTKNINYIPLYLHLIIFLKKEFI